MKTMKQPLLPAVGQNNRGFGPSAEKTEAVIIADFSENISNMSCLAFSKYFSLWSIYSSSVYTYIHTHTNMHVHTHL